MRIECKWTQAVVAQELGCVVSAIHHYENDRRKVTLELLVKFANLYEMSVIEILEPVNLGERYSNHLKHMTKVAEFGTWSLAMREP